MAWIFLAQDGTCEHSDEPLGSIKFWDILEQLRNLRLLKKCSSPWNYLVG
jgi:hypothetical protein